MQNRLTLRHPRERQRDTHDICKAYGNQFTVDELKDAENGLDAAGIVIEFNMIDMGIAEEMNKRMDKMMKNFQSGK